MTGHSGIVTEDSGQSRKSVTFNQNRRSRSVGTTGHVQTELAVNMVRNTQLEPSDALTTAYALWRLRLQTYQQLARSGASSSRLALAAAAVLTAARDAMALGPNPDRVDRYQNQE